MKLTTAQYSQYLKDLNVTLGQYLDKISNLVTYKFTYVKIGENKFKLTEIDKKYLNYVITGFDLIPNGGIFYLEEKKINDR